MEENESMDRLDIEQAKAKIRQRLKETAPEARAVLVNNWLAADTSAFVAGKPSVPWFACSCVSEIQAEAEIVEELLREQAHASVK